MLAICNPRIDAYGMGGNTMWILLLIAVVVFVYYYQNNNNVTKNSNALRMLEEKYAKGEISEEEFNEKRKNLLK